MLFVLPAKTSIIRFQIIYSVLQHKMAVKEHKPLCYHHFFCIPEKHWMDNKKSKACACHSQSLRPTEAISSWGLNGTNSRLWTMATPVYVTLELQDPAFQKPPLANLAFPEIPRADPGYLFLSQNLLYCV